MVDKVTLANVSSFQNDTSAVSTVNNNMALITTAMDNTLSRDGTSPNTMSASLDMNSNQILNLPSPATVNSPARLIDVAGNPTITVPPVGTSGATVPLLNANNTFSGNDIFSGNNTFTGTNSFSNTVTHTSNVNLTGASTLSVSPTALTTTQAFTTSQSGLNVGNITGPFIYNQIAINNNCSVITDPRTMGLYMQFNAGGANTKGGQYGMFANMNHNVASTTNGDVIALVGSTSVSIVAGGSGEHYGVNGAALATSGANILALHGGEFDVGINIGATVARRDAIRLVNQGNVAPTGQDCAMSITSTNIGGSFANGILLSTEFGAAPLLTTANFIGTNVAGATQTIANFVNLPSVTVTGNIMSFPNLTIGGNGSYSSAAGISILNGTAMPAGGTLNTGIRMSSTASFGVFFGSGVPTLSAAQGSLYLRSDGSSTSTRLYVNTNGSTTWTNVTTAA